MIERRRIWFVEKLPATGTSMVEVDWPEEKFDDQAWFWPFSR